jgi:hypothetical protein
MKKYKAQNYGWSAGEITEVEVDRVSESSVWIDGRRVAIETSYTRYFDTWEQAHLFLMDFAEARLATARNDLKRAQDRLGNVKGMKRPAA